MENLVAAYFFEMDNALTKLSQHEEGRIANLLPWNLCPRKISIGKLLGYDCYLIKAMPEENLNLDTITSFTLTTEEEVYQFLDPLFLDIVPYIKDACRTGKDLGFELAGATLYQEDANKISKLPVAQFDGIVMCFSGHLLQNELSIQKAKEAALDLWNNTENGLEPNISFFKNIQNLFNQFSKIIKLVRWYYY